MTTPTPPAARLNLTITVALVCATVLLVVMLGVFLRLQLTHTDAAPYITFITTIIALGIPSGITAYQATKGKHAAEEATVQSTKTVAQTNGVMNGALLDIKTVVDALSDQMNAHLIDHAGVPTVPPGKVT
jgi:hypothetical protein